MERITFDQLPEIVALMLEKLERIEDALAIKGHIDQRPSKDMLTVDEACSFMGMSKSTLYKMSSSNVIPLYKPTGGRIYFKRDDILEYMQQNRVKSQKEIEQEALNYVINNPVMRRAARVSKK
ncbi:helix-turn-helix domain-containing protein [Mucilaginibacter calamicampi]|uniref:Helix-turn-helix domain-containing protein n=1 Tax=Mucilaginibacter calamicampi TaxID=1302352 RepID=A0ABW2YXR7_9SPHI